MFTRFDRERSTHILIEKVNEKAARQVIRLLRKAVFTIQLYKLSMQFTFQNVSRRLNSNSGKIIKL